MKVKFLDENYDDDDGDDDDDNCYDGDDNDDDHDEIHFCDGQASFQLLSCTIETAPPSNSFTVFRNLDFSICEFVYFLYFCSLVLF